MKKRVGITGQSGFIGTHLANYLKFKCDEINIIPFEDEYFKSKNKLKNFVSQCDTIVHLAGMNRGDPEEIYKCNIDLIKKLIEVLEKLNIRPHLIFSSSVQEEKNNSYGRSKKDGRKILKDWTSRNNSKFAGLIIPNVFGPFGLPFYNSVIATFCFQLTNSLETVIKEDAVLKLIYISDLVDIIYKVIREEINDFKFNIEPTAERRVSSILRQLRGFKNIYFIKNIIPNLKNYFDFSLFNTFRSYIDYNHFPVYVDLHSDTRGNLYEIIKSNTRGQIFFSQTKPGITRGNHFHTRKIERFCVVEGNATIKLRKIGTDDIIEYKVCGDKPSVVDIPVLHTHSITNSKKGNLLTLFWSNEFYNPNDPDTYFEKVE